MFTAARLNTSDPLACTGLRVMALFFLLLALLLDVSGAGVARANLLTNGGFEQNSGFVERPDLPRVADLSGSAPTGWTRDSGDIAEYLTQTPPYLGLTVYNPVEGDYFIGAHDGEWWEQTFATAAGMAYTLSYSSAYGSVWWLNLAAYYRPGVLPGQVTLTGNALLLSAPLAGTSPAPAGSSLLDSPFVWTSHQLLFVADSSTTTLRFAGSNIQDGGFVFVDNAAVNAVPEPWAAGLLLLGLPCVWLASRERTSKRGAAGQDARMRPHGHHQKAPPHCRAHS
jgi:hypothetical protein